jgi:two-component system cell cycle response regulator DivK
VSKRILVVEDAPDNRRLLRDLLTNAGFELLEAVDGEKGVAMAAEQRPDLILMDIQLPVVDGYEATAGSKAIRTAAHSDHRRHLVCAVGDEAKAVAAGCDGYVTKPFSPRQILAQIRQFLT